VGEQTETFAAYPGIGPILPAVGYGEQQRRDLAATIAAVPCDTVVVATPIDLRRVIEIPQRAVRVHYDLQEIGRPTLADALAEFFGRQAAAKPRP
jgi:predicted GTPase